MDLGLGAKRRAVGDVGLSWLARLVAPRLALANVAGSPKLRRGTAGDRPTPAGQLTTSGGGARPRVLWDEARRAIADG